MSLRVTDGWFSMGTAGGELLVAFYRRLGFRIAPSTAFPGGRVARMECRP